MQASLRETNFGKRGSQLLTMLISAVFFLTAINGNLLGQEGPAVIEALINKLNSPTFLERESASQELVELGADAIPHLARRSVSCSPETCYRIKTTLEKICTAVNEEAFYQCTGILQTRFGSNDSAMNARLSSLKAKWKQEVKKRAIASLRTKGFVIKDPLEGRNAQAAFGNPNMIFINQGLQMSNSAIEPQTVRPKSKLPSKDELKTKIDQILDSDLETNRRLVFGNGPNDAKARRNQQAGIPMVQNGGIVIHQLGRQGQPFSYETGVELTIPKDSKITKDELDGLKDISPIVGLTLEEQNIDSDLAEVIGTLQLAKLTIDGCKVKPQQLETVDWQMTLSEVIFKNQRMSKELVAQCKRIPRLQQVSITNCEFDRDDLSPLTEIKSIRGLRLEGAEIGSEIFDFFATATNINFVSLTAVKFETSDYLELMKKRRNLQITFTAKAFLGVRGPVNVGLNSEGCQISEVIANSGAAAAGLKIDDVIEQVNGQKVSRFEDLRLHIAQHVGGDELELKIRRGSQSLNIKVELRDHTTAPRE